MADVSSLFIALALLIVFAVTSIRFGVDSRGEFRGRRDESERRGIVWDVPSRASRAVKAKRAAGAPIAFAAECTSTPCAA